jgi:hypothetical protein
MMGGHEHLRTVGCSRLLDSRRYHLPGHPVLLLGGGWSISGHGTTASIFGDGLNDGSTTFFYPGKAAREYR